MTPSASFERTMSVARFSWLHRLLLGLLATLMSVAGCARTPSLTDISSVDALKARFNADAGKPRIILLLSPT